MPTPTRKLRIPDSVAALIRNMHPDLKRKIRAAFEAISTDPCCGKALREELAGLMTYRVSTFSFDRELMRLYSRNSDAYGGA